MSDDRCAPLRAHLAAKPTDRFARYALALELAKLGRPDEALAELDTLLQHHPQSGAGHYQRGLILQAAGRREAAREAWEAGLAALSGVRDPEARRSHREIELALDALEDADE
ncbi:MAG: tetratricopeptide repeat protein [Myxococcota bacterium]